MRFPRTPLVSALLAAVLLAPLVARADPGAAYDIRRSEDYDAPLIGWCVEKYGYAYDAAHGFLTAPDGHAVTEEEATGAFVDEGPGALTERERRIMLSLGSRRETQHGRPLFLEYDSGAPVTPLRMAIARRQMADGLMDKASLPFNAAALDAGARDAYARILGMTVRDGAFIGPDGKALTNGALSELQRRVDASREPDIAAIARRSGYSIKRRGGVPMLWSVEGGWLDGLSAKALAKTFGVDPAADPAAPYVAGADFSAELKALFSKPPAIMRPDGTIEWEGKTLTAGDYARLFEPLDPGRLTPGEAIAVEIARANGFAALAGGRVILAPDGKTRLARIDVAPMLESFGLRGQESLDSVFDARLPAAAKITPMLVEAGMTLDGASGQLSREGKVYRTRDILEMFLPYDLAVMERSDPKTAAAIAALMKGHGFDTRIVNGKTLLCKDSGCISNEAMRGDLRGVATSSVLFTKMALVDAEIKRMRAGGKINPLILRRISRIAGDTGGYVPGKLAALIAEKPVSAKVWSDTTEEAAEDVARTWGAVAAGAPVDGAKPPPPSEEVARKRAEAARDGASRLAEKMDKAFEDLFRAQGSAVAAEQRSQFVDPRTGKTVMPFLALGKDPDAREAAHYDIQQNSIVFMVSPELAKKMAGAAVQPFARRTAEELAKLAAEFEDPAKLGQAMLTDPGLVAAFVRESAWSYVHERGHALSTLRGPASIERKGLIMSESWTDEEKVAFLWETRYTHEILTKNPSADIPSHELERYSRMLSGYDLWAVDMVRDYYDIMPGRFSNLRTARAAQAGWIERAKRYVDADSFPAAKEFLARLERGANSLEEINTAYEKYFSTRLPQFTKMSLEGDVNMSARLSAPGPGRDTAVALSYHAVLPARIDAALADGRISAAEAAALRARAPKAAQVVQSGLVFVKGWRAAPTQQTSPAAVAVNSARTLEALYYYCQHLLTTPGALTESGLTRDQAVSAQASFAVESAAAWRAAKLVRVEAKPK